MGSAVLVGVEVETFVDEFLRCGVWEGDEADAVEVVVIVSGGVACGVGDGAAAFEAIVGEGKCCLPKFTMLGSRTSQGADGSPATAPRTTSGRLLFDRVASAFAPAEIRRGFKKLESVQRIDRDVNFRRLITENNMQFISNDTQRGNMFSLRRTTLPRPNSSVIHNNTRRFDQRMLRLIYSPFAQFPFTDRQKIIGFSINWLATACFIDLKGELPSAAELFVDSNLLYPGLIEPLLPQAVQGTSWTVIIDPNRD